MNLVDLRSDTVTMPTPAMRAAMAAAPLGDDVYGEDPTINALESLAAERLGKEAGLFVASGTMGNLVAILTHAGRGDEAIVGEDAHTVLWEGGGMATLGGVVPRMLPTDVEGRLDPARVEASVRGDDPHLPRSRLLLLENTYGSKNGYPLPPDYFAALRAVADRHALAVHLDGARLFNAAAALGVSAAELARPVDSVSICLSKGLCAPVGSVLCGTAEFVGRARRSRKLVGGGMRQAGVLAAAGLIALRDMTDRLAEDHVRARRLASGLAATPGLRVDTERIRTNIVFFDLDPHPALDATGLADALREQHRVLVGLDFGRRLRAVTHYWIDDEAVDRLVQGCRSVLHPLFG